MKRVFLIILAILCTAALSSCKGAEKGSTSSNAGTDEAQAVLAGFAEAMKKSDYAAASEYTTSPENFTICMNNFAGNAELVSAILGNSKLESVEANPEGKGDTAFNVTVSAADAAAIIQATVDEYTAISSDIELYRAFIKAHPEADANPAKANEILANEMQQQCIVRCANPEAARVTKTVPVRLKSEGGKLKIISDTENGEFVKALSGGYFSVFTM
ncbi:MAG: hypothetical protein LBS74_11200 [Oscillospiraceae bacterium]|nr:hypothetical protein [Oscillospiraceae bacterium]